MATATRERKTFVVNDPIEKNFTLHHTYLLAVGMVLTRERVYYENVYINESEVLDNIDTLDNIQGVGREDYDFVAADFAMRGYVEPYRIRDGEGVVHHFFRVREKGMTAILTGEFLVLQDKRRIDLKNLELTQKSIDAHEHQKLINWGLILASTLASLSPFVVAKVFPPTVNVSVPEQKSHQDIRIDSVWLHQQVDGLIQKKLSTLQPKEAKEQQPPKGVTE